MAKELPYFKFEPNQWENGNIQICSREDKGLFIDLCSMYWSRLGDLQFKLAVNKLCGGNTTAFDSLIQENIFTVIDDYICIEFLNEQLQDFENISKTNAKNALEGWEKRRKQKAESDRNATALNSQSENDAIREEEIKEEKRREEKIKYNEVIDFFNNTCLNLPKVTVVSEKRKKLISARVSDFGYEKIGEVFKMTNESDFLSGKKTDFKASFDWILNPTNFIKILEGNYTNKSNEKEQKIGRMTVSDARETFNSIHSAVEEQLKG